MNNTEKNDFLVALGKRVRELRQKEGLTLEELAKKMGYTSENARSSVQKIEAGKSDLPASKIAKLAEIFGVSASFLIGLE